MTQAQNFHPFQGSGLRKLLIILIVSINLRGAITCVGPLLEAIQSHFGLSGTAAGLLTSLPLFAFSFISPYAVVLARRIGIELAVFLSLLLLLFGLGLRYVDNAVCLYLGTAFVGSGIAIGNVLLPGLLRRDFFHHLSAVIAMFTVLLVIFGGIGSGIAAPLAKWGGWRISLLAWAIPVLLALAAWLPQLPYNSRPAATSNTQTKLWNQSLAWQVSLFMGCQSAAFFVLVAWFPRMMADLAGISAARAGWIMFINQIVVLISVMLTPLALRTLADQRLVGVLSSALILLGYGGLWLGPTHSLSWMICIGVGSGSSLVLVLTLFSLRTSSTLQSVALSGMAQSVGYTLAAVIPILIGFMYDQTSSWTLPLALMVFLSALQVAMGYLAGRALTIPEQVTTHQVATRLD